jgi:hypothetical protein
VPFRLTKASCVAVGTFNIYIIQPAWLAKVGIFPIDTEVTVEANMNRPGFKLSSPKFKSTWFVAPDRLGIETQADDEDCGKLVADVLSKLIWTPISAVGNNVFLEGPRREVGHLRFDAIGGSPPEGYGSKGSTQSVSYTRDNRTYGLLARAHEEKVQLVANVHANLPEGETTDRAARIANEFQQDKTEMIRLLSHAFQVEVENVASHS